MEIFDFLLVCIRIGWCVYMRSPLIAGINANIRYKYVNELRVLICHHDNLNDKKFRKMSDKLHLTDFGTSRYANNLKYEIAESLDIAIRSRNRDDQRRRDGREYRRSGDR